MNSGLLWYALKVTPRHESMVAQLLELKGYQPFLPKCQSRRIWSDRIKTLELPLFPGYLFCPLDVRTRLPILTTPGVSFIVGTGRVPLPIDLAEIEAIRQVVAAGMPYRPHPFVSVGKKVRIQRGALAGLEGFVTEVRKEYRLIVSISLLMRSVSVDIDEGWVEPVRDRSNNESVRSIEGHREPISHYTTLNSRIE